MPATSAESRARAVAAYDQGELTAEVTEENVAGRGE
jgi:hypothetical protein